MAAAPDDKEDTVNVVKEGTKYSKHLMVGRDKFQFFHSLGITKDHFLDTNAIGLVYSPFFWSWY